MSKSPFERQILIEKQRLQQRPEPAPRGISSKSGKGGAFRRASRVLLGALLISCGLFSAALLWVLFGPPFESPRSNPHTLRAEATNDASLSRGNTVNSAGPSLPDTGPGAKVPPLEPGALSASAAGPEKPAEQAKAEAQAAPTQPPLIQAQPQPVQIQPQPGQTHFQPVQAQGQRGPSEARDRDQRPEQQQVLGGSADQHPGMQCRADLCAATYKSFNAGDCTYQPFGGGRRQICER